MKDIDYRTFSCSTGKPGIRGIPEISLDTCETEAASHLNPDRNLPIVLTTNCKCSSSSFYLCTDGMCALRKSNLLKLVLSKSI